MHQPKIRLVKFLSYAFTVAISVCLAEYQEQIDSKMRSLATSLQCLEDESKQTLREKSELEDKLRAVSEAHLTAEKTLAENVEENQSLDKRYVKRSH